MSTRTVLVVDDDVNFRSSTRRLFWIINDDAHAYEVVEAGSGSEAAAALDDQSIDCVLIDNRMPGGDGMDWIPRLLEAHPLLPIIMMTGNGDESIAVMAMQRGAVDYLVKGDVTAVALDHSVANAIEKREMELRLEAQQRALVAAERDRVMIQSFGAACHHLGQPTATLAILLELIRRQIKDPTVLGLVDQVDDSMSTIRDILDRLRETDHYDAETYLPTGSEDEPARTDSHIVAV